MAKLNISKELKFLNREYKSNLTLKGLSELCGISVNSLSDMTTNSSFDKLYNVCVCIYDFYYDNTTSYKFSHEFFSFTSVLNTLLDDQFDFYN